MILEMLRSALRSILSNKTRTFLSVLGITIGIAAVIAVVSLGEGAGSSIKEKISSLGSNILMIMPGKTMGGGKLAQAVGDVFTEDDADKLSQYTTSLEGITPILMRQMNIQAGAVNTLVSVVGAKSDIWSILQIDASEGRLTTPFDENKRVCVIGEKVKEELFGDEPALGRTISILTPVGKRDFTVIGILKPAGQLFFFRPDEAVIIPFKSAKLRIFHSKKVSLIIAKVKTPELTQIAIQEIDSYFYKKFRSEDMYTIVSQEYILQTLNESLMILNLVLGGIAAISLLVGGIGIMNIMLVSVIERTREIGIRKALGATKSSILLQFLLEAVIVTLTGGIFGIALGTIAGKVISSFINIPFILSPSVILIATGTSVAIGLFFGVFPAHKASKLDPVEALRYE